MPRARYLLFCVSLFLVSITSAGLCGEEKGATPYPYIYLTWQNNTDTTMTVSVHSTQPGEEITVYYDTKPHEGNVQHYQYATTEKGFAVPGLPAERRVYHVELQNLKPATTYYFVVGHQKTGFSEEKKFRTLSDGDESITFVEGGDWEITETSDELSKVAAKKDPMFVLLGGDYPRDVRSLSDYYKWDAWLAMYTKNMVTPDGHLIPMILAIGNQEVFEGYGKTAQDVPFFLHYFKQTSTNKTYFSRAIGKNLVLFILDSGHVASHDGEQLEWLQKEMDLQKEIPLKMAVYHIPLYPSVRFASADTFYHSLHGTLTLLDRQDIAVRMLSPYSALGREHWLPVFDKYELNTAFEHHDHALKRTKPMRGGEINPKGTLYLGDGCWGPDLQYSPIQPYFHLYFAKTLGQQQCFWLVTVDRNSILYQAISKEGAVLDEYRSGRKFSIWDMIPSP